MTNQTLENVLKHTDNFDKLNVFAHAEQTPAHVARAEQLITEAGINMAKAEPINYNGVQIGPLTDADIAALTEDERIALGRAGYAHFVESSWQNAARNYLANSQDIETEMVEGQRKPRKTLAKLVLEKGVADEITPILAGKSTGERNYAGLASDYVELASYREIVRKLEDGKPLHGAQKEHLEKAAISGAAKAKYDEVKSAGFTESARQTGSKLAMTIAKIKMSKELIQKGAEAEVARLETDLKTKYGDDYEGLVAEACGTYLTKQVGSDRRDEVMAGLSMLQYAEKGYHIGERRMADVA